MDVTVKSEDKNSMWREMEKWTVLTGQQQDREEQDNSSNMPQE
jgi:hypothetical protein